LGKTAPGTCGCGVADDDVDGDGALECADECLDGAACASSAGWGCAVGHLGPATVSWHVVLLLVVTLGLGRRRRRRAW
jgi:hypothetical protein